MKKIGILIAILALGVQARASYDCDSLDGARTDEKIEITENSSGDAKVTFLTFGSQFEFTGHVTIARSFGLRKHIVLVDEQGQPATVDVSSSSLIGRGGCGRAGCDPEGHGPKIISANLNYAHQGLQDVLFSCYEKEN